MSFVGYDAEGRFVHYCQCGKWGSFGLHASVRNGRLGIWYCAEHKPKEYDDGQRHNDEEARPQGGAASQPAREQGEDSRNAKSGKPHQSQSSRGENFDGQSEQARLDL